MTRLQKAEAMWAAAGLPRMKGLAEVARPRTAGLPAVKRSAKRAHTASKAKSRKRA